MIFFFDCITPTVSRGELGHSYKSLPFSLFLTLFYYPRIRLFIYNETNKQDQAGREILGAKRKQNNTHCMHGMAWHNAAFLFLFGCCHLNVSWLYTCTHIHMLCSLLSEQNSRQSTAAGPSTTTICKFKNQTRKERKGKRGKPVVHESGSSHHHRQSHTHIGEMGGRIG